MYKWHNPDLEQEMEFVQKIVHSIRSARSDYNLPKGTKTEGKCYFVYEAKFWYFYFFLFTVFIFKPKLTWLTTLAPYWERRVPGRILNSFRSLAKSHSCPQVLRTAVFWNLSSAEDLFLLVWQANLKHTDSLGLLTTGTILRNIYHQVHVWISKLFYFLLMEGNKTTSVRYTTVCGKGMTHEQCTFNAMRRIS